MWERRGKWRRMEERRGRVRKWTDVPLHYPPFTGAVSQRMKIARRLPDPL
jgi:hypothetical protein